MNDVGNALEPRDVRRLSDLITAAFYEACRAGNLDAAEQLVVALECEVTRSIRLVGADRREDGDDVAAIHARLQRELTRLHVIQTSADADRADRLLDLDANALHDAPLSLPDGFSNAKPVEQWTALGGHTFARARDEGREAIVLAFPAALAKDATATLRGAGFRFNTVLQHWEGLARYEKAQQLATTHGGTARRVAAPPPAAAALDDAAD